MNDIERLTELFKSFPGVGPRQAKRFVYYLLRKNSGYTSELAALIPKVKAQTKRCTVCQRFFIAAHNPTDTNCTICMNENREAEKLLLIAHDNDLEAIEKAGAYNGYYFVLGGYIPLLEEQPQKFIRVEELKSRLMQDNGSAVSEVILGLSSNADGQNTQRFIHELLETNFPTVAVTEFGKGLSTGSEIEYADADTIKNALENRK